MAGPSIAAPRWPYHPERLTGGLTIHNGSMWSYLRERLPGGHTVESGAFSQSDDATLYQTNKERKYRDLDLAMQCTGDQIM